MNFKKAKGMWACAPFAAGICFAQDNSVPLMQEVVPDHLAYLYSKARPATAAPTAEQLVAGQRRWENGRRLRVCLFSGNPAIAQLVRMVASEWTTETGLTFDFGPSGGWYNCLDPRLGFPEIRIGFSERGYWSYVGSDSERYGGDRAPSMNFDSFNRLYNDLRYSIKDVVEKADPYHKATIRHEFGHALGLLHEHQNPKLNCFAEIKWEGPGNAFEQFGGHPNFWTREQVTRNLGFIGATDPDFIAGDPDPKSVMKYYFIKSIFKNPASECAGPTNYEISQKDKQIVAKIYPRNPVGAAAPKVSETLETAFVRPAPQFVTQNDSSDYVQRILQDLESDDTATRRNARVRLSQVLGQPSASDAVETAVNNLPKSSYRYRLGVAVALGNAAGPVEVSKSAAKIITDQRKRAIDPTLKSALGAAQSKLKTQ